MAQFRAGEPITRDQLLTAINGIEASWALWNGSSESIGAGASQPGVDGVDVHTGLKASLALLDKYGVSSMTDLPAEVRATIPGGGIFINRSPKTFGTQFRDFVTNPAFLTAAGGLYGVYSGAAGAAGGASSGAGAAAGLDPALAAGAAGGAAGTAGGGLTAAQAAGVTGTGAAATGLSSVASPTATSAGGSGMVPGVGEYGELGAAGWEGNIPGGPGVTSTAGTGTALSRIMAGDGTTSDYLELFGQAVPSLIGAYASDKQTDALKGLAARYEGFGAPYRQRLADSYSNPMAYLQSPEVTGAVQQGTNSLARALSTQGNPAASGSALHELQNYSTNQQLNRLGQERDRLAGFGGLTQYQAAAPQLAAGAIASGVDYWNALGSGVANVVNPPRQNMTLAQILKQYNISEGLS